MIKPQQLTIHLNQTPHRNPSPKRQQNLLRVQLKKGQALKIYLCVTSK